jgi:TonB family protein
MSFKKMKRHSLTQALVVAVACLGTSFAFSQQAAGSSYVGRHDNGLVAASAEHSQSAAVENQVIHQVGGAVLPPKAIHAPAPKYTYAARRARLEGDCIVELVVDAQGRPQDIHMKKALDGGLDKNAIKAVKKYRFKPATLNGTPVAVQIDIDIHFSIY